MSDLFANLPPQPAPSPAAATARRPKHWRRPGTGEQACRECGGASTCFIGDAAFCIWCAPADYWPNGRPAWL